MSDIWNFYATQDDPEPGIVFLDLGLSADAPLPGYEHQVRLEVSIERLRDNGMPIPEELQRLSELEDYLEESLPEDAMLFVGRKTLAGRRDFFFYATNALPAEQTLAQAMVGFGEYEYELHIETDPDWRVYRALYPSPREVQTIRNHDVLAQLQSHGDDLSRPRTVTHWSYFRTPESRRDFVAALAGSRFSPSHETETMPERDFPHGQVVEHRGPVDIESIDEAVLELYDLTARFEGDYDGWETVVVQSESAGGE